MTIREMRNGALAGVAGGLVFGGLLAAMGMFPMIGKMVGSPTVAAGIAVHLVNSAVIGAGYAALFRRRATVGTATAYGAAWWVLGPLTLMPLFLGMGLGVNWTLAAAQKMLPSLMGHMIFGLVLGLAYGALSRREAALSPAHAVAAR